MSYVYIIEILTTTDNFILGVDNEVMLGNVYVNEKEANKNKALIETELDHNEDVLDYHVSITKRTLIK